MPEETSISAISELIEFLNSETRTEVRHSAIAYIVGVSATPEGPDLFQLDNFTLTKTLCALFESVSQDRPALYSAFINITSVDALTANFIIEHSAVVPVSTTYCKNIDLLATDAAKLLSNLSLHFSAKVYNKITEVWPTFLSDVVDLLNNNNSELYVDYLGYTLVNCTELPSIRRIICEKYVKKLLPLTLLNDQPKRRLVAVDVLRNLCFDDANHEKLLDADDEFLAALVAPLADIDDQLDDDEIQKLPIQLQYYDKRRCQDPLIGKKLIEALYQLCATKHGRTVLRSKGIYSLLREFDKATSREAKPEATEMKCCFFVSDAETSTLHSLIGILIRLETEMSIDPNLTSIRNLQ